MSLTIFPSLTTIFSGGGHHSPPHPTISPQPTNTLTKINHNALNTSRKSVSVILSHVEETTGGGIVSSSTRYSLGRYTITGPPRSL
ncbi:hypothetical protein Hanom_Chr05g00466341 [Helianthus anomalus]